MLGFSCLYSSIFVTTFGVATFGLLPPITPGLMDPVSKYLKRRRGNLGFVGFCNKINFAACGQRPCSKPCKLIILENILGS